MNTLKIYNAINSIRYIIVLYLLLLPFTGHSQELGSNFNHNPEIIDFKYLEEAQVNWIRTTPRIMDYIYGDLRIKNDAGLSRIVEAGKKATSWHSGFAGILPKTICVFPQQIPGRKKNCSIPPQRSWRW
ncbi:hypothetical protein [Sinomicrobium weinanense]|uniref:hypothetical protein n=1 Tax=Sinomicrobium weinanense TaxID=2842200 RepID=UPI001CAA53BE|nr:hypothetical protein [Sinomicrobium weinanense]MBU3125940.1 hypothetical protein [Sinomicrobium weinanense]